MTINSNSNPLVSVIVTTYNNTATLDACLRSITQQSYQPIELIVVDNNSIDDTKDIARRHTSHVFNKGPERSAQRNFGVGQAKGKYVAIIDSDMELGKNVIGECIQNMQDDIDTKGMIIPEESFGQGFWAQCKRLERSFYVGIDWMEAARFFDRSLYLKLGGYNENLVSGEDWDLSQRVKAQVNIGRINSFILHNEGRLKLSKTLKKKYYYAQKFRSYVRANQSSDAVKSQTGPLTRYKLFFASPGKLLKNPVRGIGMLFMKTCEFGFGAIGYWAASRKGEG